MTDSTEAEDNAFGARFDFCGIDDRADAGRHATADIAHLVEGGVLADFATAISGRTVKFAKVEHPM